MKGLPVGLVARPRILGQKDSRQPPPTPQMKPATRFPPKFMYTTL